MKNEMKKLVSGALCLVLGALCLVLGAGSALAATVMFKGETITYENATTCTGGGNDPVVLTFKDTSATGSITVPYDATATILAVGGGGAGGTGNTANNSGYRGVGGNGGEVVENSYTLAGGSKLTISVGAGGARSTLANSSGGNGKDSTVKSSSSDFADIVAGGGTGGTANNTSGGVGQPTVGTTSVIDGNVYGKGGANYGTDAAVSGADNTGDGGQGGRRSSTSSQNYGGNGGSGVVIVKITSVQRPIEPVVTTFEMDVGSYTNFTCTSEVSGGWGVTSSNAFAAAGTITEENGKTCKLVIRAYCTGDVDDPNRVSDSEITVRNEGAVYVYRVRVDPVIKDRSKWIKMPLKAADGKFHYIAYEGAEVKTNGMSIVFTFTNNTFGAAKADAYADGRQSVPGRLELPAPFAYRANVLAVGGGGAGGTQSRKTFGGGGGGAGGYMEKWNEAIDPGVLYVEVGTGAPAASGAVTADKGLNGGLSIVTNSLGAVIVSALGGGGGGGGRLGEDGQPGGSGGGGAWIDSASSTKGGVSQAGTGMDGQGNVGGTPMPVEKGGAGYPNAAGGGGAAQTTNETTYVSWGAGLATGEGGLGRTNDITGVAREYAHGGRGGNESLPRGRGADGADGLGNGGDGGNGNCGGAGGNGVVVIAIAYAYENVHIQPPTIGVESGPTNRTTLLRGDLGLRTEYYDNGISEFCWTNNSTETYVSFNTNAFVRNGQGGYVYDAGDEKKKLTFGDIVKYWDGTSETNVVVETDAKTGHLVTNNVCHHNFTIYLKDGYVWYDGTAYGSSKGHYVDWRITESFNTVDATIGVKKIVDWLPDGSNATITVTTHSTPAMYKRVPNVLFLGTRCGNHDLTAQVVTESIKSISSKGNVDWFLFGSTGTGSGEGLWRHGSVPQGGATPTFTDSTSLTGGDIVKISNGPHKSLKLFYSYFDAIFYGNKDTYVKEDAEEDFYKGTNHYDYVIIETDGSRVAHGYTGRDAEQEKRVAEALLKYYANSNVIWIVDNGVDYKEYFNYCSGKSGFSNYTDIFEYGDAYGKKYRVNNGFLRKNGEAGQYMNFCEGETSTSSTTNHDTWKALLGIFDPALYLSGELYYGEQGTSDEGMKTRNALTTTNQAQSQNQIFYAGHPYEENQAFYDNVESVTHLLDQVIKPEIYDFKGGDQVLESKGLTLTHVDFYWTDKDPYQSVPEAWGPRRTYWDAKEHPQDYKNNLIEVHAATNYVITTVTNVDYELWAKMDIGIVDDGTFKTSVDAVFNPTTGQYEKNPNNGEAKASMKSQGSEKEVKGSATTSAAWKYFAYKVGGAVENGEIFLNGLTGYRSIAFCEGYSPTVSYRGKPGYMINELWIDSNLVEDPKGDVESFATFAKIARDHDVIVSYTNFVTGIASAPTNYVYDGQAHVFPVFVDTVENPPYRTEVRYALEEDSTNYLPAAEFCATNCAALKDKGEYKFYFKVYSYQPGYGESFTNGWGEIKEIDLGDVKIVGHGQNTVTITPAPLTITAGSTTNIEIQVAQQTVNALIDEMAKSTNVICKGFVNGEGMEALDFSDLKMTCATYDPDSSRPGQYDIDITEGSVTALKGNYAITLKPGKLNVGKSAFEVSGIRQTGDGETGVDDAVKVYDGEPTNISVNVTFPLLPEQYTIKYRIGEDGVWTNGIGEAHLPGFSFTDVVETNVWYALESDFCFPATNCAKVIITPRPVTLQSASATHPYNGKTLMTNFVWVVDKDVRDYGWAPGEGLKEKDGYTCQGALAAVGTMANTFLYTLRDNTKATNYDITITNGLLTVTRAPMVIGDPNDPAKQVTYPTSEAREDWPEVNGVQDVYTTYDGKGTNILVNVIDPSSVLERKIWYSTNQVDWAQNLLLTNVYNGPMYFKVEDTNHNYYTAMNVAYLVISQRVATVTAAGASKVYDGTALATDDFTTDNFVKGEGIASVEMTADSSIVNASTTNNVIDKSSVEPLEGTLLSNYKLEFKDGTLEVTKRPLTLKSPDKSAKWECDPVTFLASEIEDVSEGENSGYVDDEELKYTVTGKQSTPGSSNASFKWSDSDDGKTLVSNYDVAHVFGTLTIGEGAIEIRRQKQPQSGDDPTPAPGSEESGVNPVEVFYDGLGHSIEVDVTYPMDYTIQYREDKSDVWSDVNPAYTNVCTSNVVWYSVNADGYYPVTNCAWVTVKPRPITVTANDQEMTYGEDMPDLAGEFTIDDPVDSKVGDVFTVPLAYTNDTTVTVNAGTYPEAVMTNAAIVVSNDTADVTECYDITFVPGKLTVNKAKMSVTVTDVETTYEYKSKGTNISVSVTSPTEVPTRIEYSLDGGLTWTNELALTEAGTYPVTFRVTDGDNYATLTSNGTVKINRRYITVTADDKEISVEESKRLTGEYLDKFVTYKVTVDGTTPLETLPDGEVAKLRINVGIHALLGEPGEYRHTERDEDGQPWGTTVGGDMEQGNYILAFRGGDLVIFNRQRIGYESMDVVVPYDGEGHGIREVVVTNPAAWKPGDDYEVAYSRYDLDTRTYFDWQDSPIAAITNVTEWGGAVMGFAITPVGPDADKYQAVTNTATVTVTQRVVTVTATNAWKYVDTPDPAFGATVKGLIEKEQARAGELIKYSVSRTNDTEAVGVYTNVIVASGSADQGNYSVVYKPADFEIKQKPAKPFPLIDPVNVVTNYDGTGHMYEMKFDWSESPKPADLKIVYSQNEHGDDYTENYCLTNVYNGGEPVTVYFKVTGEDYIETNGFANVTITQRVATVTAKSASKTYDGTPLTCDGFTTTGFVIDIPGRVEGVESVEMTEDSTVTDAGDPVSNKIAKITWLKPYTDLGNYVVVTNQGELSVMPYSGATVKVKGNTRTTVYTGAEQETNGWEFVSSSTNILKKEWVTLKDGVSARAAGTDASEDCYEMGLTEDDFVCTSKNFANVNFDVEDGWLKIDPADIGGFGAKDFGPFTYKGTPWEPTDEVVVTNAEGKTLKFGMDYEITGYRDNTNATDKAIVEIAGLGNYTGTLEVPFTISKALLTVTADDKSVVFGEEAPTFTYKMTGFVNEETETDVVKGKPTLSSDYKKGVTPAGTELAIEVDVSKLQADNYTFKPVNGTLKVTAAEIAYNVNKVETTYDGTTNDVAVTVLTPTEGAKVEYSYDGGDTWTNEVPRYVNATNGVTVTFRVTADNYAAVTGSVTVAIARRRLVLSTASKIKAYDGTPLVSTNVIAESYAPGECFYYPPESFGSQTVVGESPASFAYEETATTKFANYEIDYKPGTLTVEPGAGDIQLVSLDGTWTYDPTVSVYETNAWYAVNSNLFAKGDYPVVMFDPGAKLTKVGDAENTFTFVVTNDVNGDVTEGYTNITTKAGHLRVNPRKITAGDVTAEGYDGFYTADAHGAKVTSFTGAKVKYLTEDAFTNVTNATVRFEVSADENYTPYTGTVDIVIRAIPVRFYTENKSKTYDNTPLAVTAGDVKTEFGGGVEGFPSDEGFKFVEPFGSITDPGSKPASFGCQPKDGTLISNYDVKCDPGTLTVYAAGEKEITIVAESMTFDYDGEAHTNWAWHVANENELTMNGHHVDSNSVVFAEASVITRPGTKENRILETVRIVDGSGAEVPPLFGYKVHYAPGTLTMNAVRMPSVMATSVTNVYDAEGHSITVEAKGLVKSTPTYLFSATGEEGSFVPANPAYTNVNTEVFPTYRVYWKVTAPGYLDETGWSTVTVTQRVLSVKSEGAEKTYDGDPLTKLEASITSGSLAGKDVIGYAFKNSQTDVGRTENLFECSITNRQGEVVTGNYDIRKTTGWLEVTPFPVKVTITVKDKDYDATTNATCDSTVIAGPTGGALPHGESLKLDEKGMEFYFVSPNVGTWDVTNDVWKDSFVLTNAPGMLRGNYKIADVAVNQATIREIQAPNPDGPDYDPDDVGPFPGPKVPGGPKAPPAPDPDPDNRYTLSDYDVVTNYDGEAHTFDTNKLFAKLAEIKDVYAEGGLYGNKYGVDYSTNGVDWVAEPYAWVNVADTPTSFWYRVSVTNMNPVIHAVGVTILPKESPLNVRIVPVDEFPWNGETDWYHVATNGLIVTDADGKTLEMGTDYACVEVEAVDITNALLKVRGIGNYEGSAGQTNFWVSGYKVSVWIEDACQGTNFCGALSGTEVGTNVVLEGYAIDLPHSVTNGTVVKVDRMASEDILHLVARLATDSNGDGVPDKYQRMLTFRVINGYWTDEDDKAIDSAPRTVWITKFNADGKWDVNGSNTLAAADIPCVGQRPIGNNFAKGGKWWTGASDVLTDTLVGLTVDNAISPLLIFGYNHAPAGGSRRTGGGQPLDPVFRTTVKIADFAYADGKATFGPRVDVMEGDALVVSMPMEDSMVTIKGKKTLEDQDWTAIGEFRTNGHGYVIIETGDYKFFTIETK